MRMTIRGYPLTNEKIMQFIRIAHSKKNTSTVEHGCLSCDYCNGIPYEGVYHHILVTINYIVMMSLFHNVDILSFILL